MSAPVDFGSVRRSMLTARDFVELAGTMAQLDGDPDRVVHHQKTAAAALREAADRLDPPQVIAGTEHESAGLVAEYEAHFEQIREGLPSLARDWIHGDGGGVSDHEIVVELVLGVDRRRMGQVTAGWLRRCAGMTTS